MSTSTGMNSLSQLMPGNRRCHLCNQHYTFNADPQWYTKSGDAGRIWGVCTHCGHDMDSCRDDSHGRQVGPGTVRILR